MTKTQEITSKSRSALFLARDRKEQTRQHNKDKHQTYITNHRDKIANKLL